MLHDLHFRQHYALSTSNDPGNAKWKQRSSRGFLGKIMVYSRQRYALNHSGGDVTTTTVTMRTVTNGLDNVRQLSAAARHFSFSGCLLAALDAGL